MRLRNELDVTVVALVAIQVLTSFAAIGLLARTGPAVERILRSRVIRRAHPGVRGEA